MHSTIYIVSNPKDQITDSEITLTENEVFERVGDYGTGIDYAVNDGSRKEWLSEIPGFSFDKENNLLTIEDGEKYFKRNYEDFIKKAKELCEKSFDEYIECRYNELQSCLYSLTSLYDDKQGIIVMRAYRTDSGRIDYEINTLDGLVRWAIEYPEFSQYRVHDSYDYHY